jgi:ABC-type nitrate/sulfonate/bicarbonate transport system substrate-binding protein
VDLWHSYCYSYPRLKPFSFNERFGVTDATIILEIDEMRQRFAWFSGLVFFLGGMLLMNIAVTGSMAQEKRNSVRLHIPGYSPNSMPFQIAEDKGYYKDEGITVQTVRMKTGAGVQAMLAESVDVSQILGLTVRAAISRGAPVKIAMVFNDRVLYRLMSKSQFSKVTDLKGRIIASTTPGASNDELLKRVLVKQGLEPKKDLTVIYIGESVTLFQALTRGSVDAAVLNPPYNLLAKEAGFRELAEFSSETGALQGGVSMTDKFLRERADVARGFIRATWRGLRFFRTDRAGTVPIMSKYMNIERDMAEKIYDASVDAFTDTGFISDDFQKKVMEFEFGKAEPAMLQKAFDFSLVRSLQQK